MFLIVIRLDLKEFRKILVLNLFFSCNVCRTLQSELGSFVRTLKINYSISNIKIYCIKCNNAVIISTFFCKVFDVILHLVAVVYTLLGFFLF
jgi:hypothetical protein